MENNIKISIVTVTYNCQDLIEETLLSVLNQTYPNIELIIVDGGSKDGTLDIIEKYRHRIKHFISEPDRGIYDAMNKGIGLASGDFINFMNAGDHFISFEIISNIFGGGSTDKYDIIFGDALAMFNGFSKIFKGEYPSKRHIMNFNHQAVFVRTSLMKKYKFDTKYKICADRDFFTNVYLRENAKFYYYESQVAVIEAMGFSSSNTLKSRREDLQIKRDNVLISNIDYNLHLIIGRLLYFVRALLPKNLLNLYHKKIS